MGGSSFSRDDYKSRTSYRSSVATDKGIDINSATFAYDYDIKMGKAAAVVHASLSPNGVKIREARDSEAHPVSVPIAVIFDTTGSMASVPAMLQKDLCKLMGFFLDDKASGKKYLGEGYPAIMVGAVDDYDAMHGEGCLQIGQFESGLEIDDNLSNVWLTGRGGGTYDESYQLALYFMARHTVHDHMEKRGKKGYLFIIGDEHAYKSVKKSEVIDIIGDAIQDDISLQTIVEEAQKLYNVFFILPSMTSHYGDRELEKYWVKLLGQQNFLRLEDPHTICECIVGAVALCEQYIDLNDLEADGVSTGLSGALVPLSKVTGEVSKYSADGLPVAKGEAGSFERL
jgi:hypothetical protein